MADPGRTRDFSAVERRPSELDNLATRDESELYDEDNVEAAPSARKGRVEEIRSPNPLGTQELRGSERPVNDAVQADSTRSNVNEEARADRNKQPDTQIAADRAGQGRLFSEFEVNDFRTRWNDVQAGFVDSPRHAVEQADQLVANVMERITSGFAQERSSLEKQWDRGDNVSTEDLRVALQRYREFFGRLLTAA